ncbi:hypothetical protein [Flavobacterium sp. CGRL2]
MKKSKPVTKKSSGEELLVLPVVTDKKKRQDQRSVRRIRAKRCRVFKNSDESKKR